MLDENTPADDTSSGAPVPEPAEAADSSVPGPPPDAGGDAPARKAVRKTTARKRTTKAAAAAPAAESGTPDEPSGTAEPAGTPEQADAAPAKKAATKKAPAKKAAAKKAPAKRAAATKATSASAEAPAGEDSVPATEPPGEAVAPAAEDATAAAAAAPLFQAPEKPAPRKRAPRKRAAAAPTEEPAAETAETAEPGEAPARPARQSRTKAASSTKAAAPETEAAPDTTGIITGTKDTAAEGEEPEEAAVEGEEPEEAVVEAAEVADGEPADNTGDSEGSEDSEDTDDSDDTEDTEDTEDTDDEQSGDGSGGGRRRRRRGGRRRRRGGGGDGEDADDRSGGPAEGGRPAKTVKDATAVEDGSTEESGDDGSSGDEQSGQGEGPGSSRRRRRRRRTGDDGGEGGDDPENTVTRVRKARSPEDEITSLSGSTRLEAKKQRRREGREAGRRRAPIVSEAEFLARRESVERVMVIRQREDLTQIAVLEDKVLVEHYVARESQTSLIGNVYLGRVQNVLPSMEAAFVDIGKGRNAVLYAGEVNWSALGHKDGQPRKIESVLSSGQSVLVQVTKDPLGHKGARLTSQVSLAGRFLVYVPDGTSSGISRKLPDTERGRLKSLLKEIVPDSAGVIVRTAAEGASEEELTRDVERLKARWEDIEAKAKGQGPKLLYGEPDLTLKVVRDLFTEDFTRLVIEGDDAWDTVQGYVTHVAPDLEPRLERYERAGGPDVFAAHRVDEQIAKGLDRKVWLPSGGSLVIDRTEAMTVVDVNTGKFTGSGGNLEETVTRNNLEAAEEIVRQLRLRDIGGIIVVDFIDMVLESNRDLVLRRLVECLGRDRTRHQVAEVTSLGLVQMTRKRIGTGLLEAFSESCEHCQGRGLVLHDTPVEPRKGEDEGGRRGGRKSKGKGEGKGEDHASGGADERNGSGTSSEGGSEGANGGGGRSRGRGGRGRGGRGEGDTSSAPAVPPALPSPAVVAAMARPEVPTDLADDATDATSPAAPTSPDGPGHEPQGTTAEPPADEAVEAVEAQQPAEPAAPRVVTRTRRRTAASRPTGVSTPAVPVPVVAPAPAESPAAVVSTADEPAADEPAAADGVPAEAATPAPPTVVTRTRRGASRPAATAGSSDGTGMDER